MSEPIILTVHQDEHGSRTTTVMNWPRETMFDPAIFGQADPAHLVRDGDCVTITVANGRAVYELLGGDDDPHLSIPARLISARLSDPPHAGEGE